MAPRKEAAAKSKTGRAAQAPKRGKRGSAFGSRIEPEKNEYHDHFLDVIGNDFKFSHAKGLAEWVKNSADAYATTTKTKDSEHYILLRFKEANPKRDSVFECIDFVGMTRDHIDKAAKIWGLPTAAKKGTNKPTYGGHGNGGKFYMRQMFKRARFITYRGGLLNVFGFNERKQYGYAASLKDKSISLEEALEFAAISNLKIPPDVLQRWKKRPDSAGFTVVRGEEPEHFRGRSTVRSLLDNLRFHPQARRVLAHLPVLVLAYDANWGERLLPPQLAPRPGFEEELTFPLPAKYTYEGEVYEFRSKTHPAGKLVLRTSDTPLARSGELAALNSVDFLGEMGCIASYRVHELGFLHHGAEAEFVYGECYCPFLEDENLNCVRNDREKFEDVGVSFAVRAWVREKINELTGKMAEKSRSEKKHRDLQQSSLFNQVLDRWKNRFMVTLSAELHGGKGQGGGFGGTGGGSTDRTGSGASGAGRIHDGPSDRMPYDTGDTGDGGGQGDEKRKAKRFPLVLLSGHDTDPLDHEPVGPFEVDERQPPVYQRDIDVSEGIYWINTARPLAQKIMEQCGSDSSRWREYMFQRYVDIIFKQQVYELAKRELNLTPDKIDRLLDQISSRVHDAAASDLERFLFEENLSALAAAPNAADVE